MATFKHTGGVSAFGEKLIAGMMARGYDEEFARRTFSQLEGFGSYGFPESHAASFALIAYASSWVKCHHPDVFCAALLNAQPMAFYARPRSCATRANMASKSDLSISTLALGLYLGTGRKGRAVSRSDGHAHGARIRQRTGRNAPGREDRPAFIDVEDVWRRGGAQVGSLVRFGRSRRIAAVMGLARREALSAIKALRDIPLPLFAARRPLPLPKPMTKPSP